MLNIHLIRACSCSFRTMRRLQKLGLENWICFNSVSSMVRRCSVAQHETSSSIYYFPFFFFSLFSLLLSHRGWIWSLFFSLFLVQIRVGWDYSNTQLPNQLKNNSCLKFSPSVPTTTVPATTLSLHLSPLSRNLMAKTCSSTRASLSTLLLIELVPAKCNNTNNFVHFHYLETRNLKWNIPKLKHFYFVGYKVLTIEMQIHKSVLNSSFIISNSRVPEFQWTWVFPHVKITLEQIEYFFIFNYTIKLEN